MRDTHIRDVNSGYNLNKLLIEMFVAGEQSKLNAMSFFINLYF